jgi:hypothetical protein
LIAGVALFLKPDFEAAIQAAASSRPAAAEAYQAGDPLFLASIEAEAAMLAMVSAQLDVAETEPFLKARDGTVLADAALKGILPLARPAKVTLSAKNTGTVSVTFAAARSIVDPRGRRYSVDASATIAAGATATITATQSTTRVITHTVTGAAPFYEIQIPASTDGLFVVGVDVQDTTAAFTYTPDFCNVAPGARVFHVETDEYRRLWVRFGASSVLDGQIVGHQPADGDVITITVTECEGAVELEAGAKFAVEYIATAAEGDIGITLSAVNSAGGDPPSMAVLRMLSRYPALYDGNAVFLGNFDFLLRRRIGSALQFLSIWNEQIEETVRTPSLLNMNTLFVSYSIPTQTAPVSEAQIRGIIAGADDSYRVRFVTPVVVNVPITVVAEVAAVHDVGDVEAQIRTVLLSTYGLGSIAASQGLRSFRFQEVNALLKAGVAALQDQLADFRVTIGTTPTSKPEDFRYLTTASITVTVTRVQAATGLWNA